MQSRADPIFQAVTDQTRRLDAMFRESWWGSFLVAIVGA